MAEEVAKKRRKIKARQRTQDNDKNVAREGRTCGAGQF